MPLDIHLEWTWARRIAHSTWFAKDIISGLGKFRQPLATGTLLSSLAFILLKAIIRGQPVIDAEKAKTASEDKRVRDHVRKMLSKLVQLQQQKRVAGRKAS